MTETTRETAIEQQKMNEEIDLEIKQNCCNQRKCKCCCVGCDRCCVGCDKCSNCSECNESGCVCCLEICGTILIGILEVVGSIV